MGSKISVEKLFVVGLVLPACALAQEPSPLANVQSRTTEGIYSAYLPKLMAEPSLSAAGTNTSFTLITKQAQANNWKNDRLLPGTPYPFTSTTNIHLTLTPAFNAQALSRIPFYITAPYWLPHSRPFPANDNPQQVNQPATHGAVINDIATLIRSASTE